MRINPKKKNVYWLFQQIFAVIWSFKLTNYEIYKNNLFPRSVTVNNNSIEMLTPKRNEKEKISYFLTFYMKISLKLQRFVRICFFGIYLNYNNLDKKKPNMKMNTNANLIVIAASFFDCFQVISASIINNLLMMY